MTKRRTILMAAMLASLLLVLVHPYGSRNTANEGFYIGCQCEVTTGPLQYSIGYEWRGTPGWFVCSHFDDCKELP